MVVGGPKDEKPKSKKPKKATQESPAGADTSGVVLREAQGNLVTVDRALCCTVLEYLAKNDLIEKFSEYLADKGQGEIILDVSTANNLKRFFVQAGLKDTKARMIIQSSCGGGGGGNGGGVVAGVRG